MLAWKNVSIETQIETLLVCAREHKTRKFLLRLIGRSKGWGRGHGRRRYWMVGRRVHRFLRTWLGLLIIVCKRVGSACAAISLKESASSGRKPPRLARRLTCVCLTVL